MFVNTLLTTIDNKIFSFFSQCQLVLWSTFSAFREMGPKLNGWYNVKTREGEGVRETEVLREIETYHQPLRKNESSQKTSHS